MGTYDKSVIVFLMYVISIVSWHFSYISNATCISHQKKWNAQKSIIVSFLSWRRKRKSENIWHTSAQQQVFSLVFDSIYGPLWFQYLLQMQAEVEKVFKLINNPLIENINFIFFWKLLPSILKLLKQVTIYTNISINTTFVTWY